MANNFSKRSIRELATCDDDLIKLFGIVVKNYDCTILQGERDAATQDEYFRTGKSKLKFPKSKHNKKPGSKKGVKACDVAPYPIDWNDQLRFYHFAGYVKGVADMLGIKVRWGGDWDSDNDFLDQTFNDLVHWELA